MGMATRVNAVSIRTRKINQSIKTIWNQKQRCGQLAKAHQDDSEAATSLPYQTPSPLSPSPSIDPSIDPSINPSIDPFIHPSTRPNTRSKNQNPNTDCKPR